jgi:thiamine pyrophosphate-dependent acetolactate synthase large subunit-like protein
MMPERILADLRAAMPRDAILTTDVGWNKNGVAQQFPIYTPGSILTPAASPPWASARRRRSAPRSPAPTAW